ncbi:hypothetical protein HU200_054607 [Digitaria exilis]|uniref:Uncharacterized protein n=1 Tax=Digitaria exilis TaxID=1010633 RepID=A0A835AH67_9POAL|nr:hypothetical protein HU200_054607 [Digitaria exilis]
MGRTSQKMYSPVAGLADPLMGNRNGGVKHAAGKDKYWVPADEEELLAAAECDDEDGRRPLLYIAREKQHPSYDHQAPEESRRAERAAPPFIVNFDGDHHEQHKNGKLVDDRNSHTIQDALATIWLSFEMLGGGGLALVVRPGVETERPGMPSPATGGDGAGLAEPLLANGDGGAAGQAFCSGGKDKWQWVPADEGEEEQGRPLLYRTFKVRGILIHPYRLINLARLILVIQFFIWRIRHKDSDNMTLWWITVVGDFWFAVSWLLNQASKLNPIRRVPNLELLNQRFDPPAGDGGAGEHLPAVDVFINTVMLNHPGDEPQLGAPASSDSPLDLSAVDVRLPMLVYIAREKRPGYDHQKKAGAMNVQLRVSALLSNAPFIINFDGDHYINNSSAFRAAMCFMLDDRHGEDTAFVQFPQRFDDVDPTDRYCNHNRVFFDATALGLNGIQGPSYVGTGCMFRRAALYGADPPRWQPPDGRSKAVMDSPWKQFGNSMPFINSVPLATQPVTPPASTLDERLAAELADVSTCAYEDGTEWGYGVGWVYNIATEDVVTGFRIHRKGWRSMYCAMEPDAFRGTAPINLTERLHQILRWSGGSLDMFFSRNCPLLAGRRLHPMQRVVYTNMTIYPVSAAFIFVYDLLPLMWLSGDEFYIQKPYTTYVAYLFAGIAMMEVSGMVEIKWAGLTLLDWCRNEQFYMIGATGVYPAAVLHSLLRLVGLKGLPFKLTSKPQSVSGGAPRERFAEMYEVKWSPLLVPTVVVMIVNVAAVGAAIGRAAAGGWSFVQLVGAAGGLLFNAWVLLLLYPFALGIMGRWSKRPYVLFVVLVVVLAAIASAYLVLLAVFAPRSVSPVWMERWSVVRAIVSPANWRI